MLRIPQSSIPGVRWDQFSAGWRANDQGCYKTSLEAATDRLYRGLAAAYDSGAHPEAACSVLEAAHSADTAVLAAAIQSFEEQWGVKAEDLCASKPQVWRLVSERLAGRRP
ncbi:hypothetical protein ABPG75_009764 [Micractinium tetrahymenae]